MKKLFRLLIFILAISNTINAQSPVAHFSCSDTIFCEKQCIDFVDLSTNNPTSWHWFFWGGIPDTSSYQNPFGICYNNYGSFDVTLVACNSFGCDTITYNQFIQEIQNPVDSIFNFSDTLFSWSGATYQWFEVNLGLIPGATNYYYVPASNGAFYCLISNAYGCYATSNTIALNALSDNSFLGLQIKTSPNPFTAELEIAIPKLNFKHASIIIRDLIGATVFESEIIPTNSEQKSTIDLSFLKNGMFLLEVAADDFKVTKKIVKEN